MTQTASKPAPKCPGPVACENCDLYELCCALDGFAKGWLPGAQTRATLRSLAPGAVLYREGMPLRGIYAVRKGIVKALRTDPSGEKHTVAFHVPGEVLGLDGFSTRQCTADVIAVTPTIVCELPVSLLMTSGPAAERLRVPLQRLLSQPAASAAVRQGRSTKRRLRAFLCELADRLREHGFAPSDVYFDTTRREFAEVLGAHVDSLRSAIEELECEGELQFEARRFRIPSAGSVAGRSSAR